MKNQAKLSIPPSLSFSFQNYLQEQGRQFLNLVGEKVAYDNTLKLFALLEGLHVHFFEQFALQTNITRTEKKETSGGKSIFDFPTDTYTITYQNEKAKYELILERMLNGHMGYYEDDVKAVFSLGDKQCKLTCYIFVSNELKIETLNFSAKEFKKILDLLEKTI